MNRRKLKFFTLVFALILLFASCTPVEDENEAEQAAMDSIITSLEEEIERLETRNQELEETLLNLESSQAEDPIEDDHNEEEFIEREDSDIFLIKALRVMEDIKAKDFESISDYVGEDGLLFSPYGYVDRENSVILSKNDLEDLDENEEEYEWGNYDGIGEPIILDFNSYYDEFIYDQDFLNPHIIGNNVRIGVGNTIDNIQEVFNDSVFVEFHFEGFDDEFEGLDWVSLRLVFAQDGSTWNLLAIVHDQWTI